jgi:predicted DNA-binding ribbon-helix-helix protein
MSDLFRAQILLERYQHEALLTLARRRRKSISELVREILAEHLEQEEYLERDQACLALDKLRSIRERQPVYKGDLVAEIREERIDQLEDTCDQSL